MKISNFFSRLFNPGNTRQPLAIKGGGLIDLDGKRELETSLHKQFKAWYGTKGVRSLLEPGLYVVLDENGPSLVSSDTPSEQELARVEVRSLFTARCALVSGHLEPILPMDNLRDLATDATRELSQKINELARNNTSAML